MHVIVFVITHLLFLGVWEGELEISLNTIHRLLWLQASSVPLFSILISFIFTKHKHILRDNLIFTGRDLSCAPLLVRLPTLDILSTCLQSKPRACKYSNMVSCVLVSSGMLCRTADCFRSHFSRSLLSFFDLSSIKKVYHYKKSICRPWLTYLYVGPIYSLK